MVLVKVDSVVMLTTGLSSVKSSESAILCDEPKDALLKVAGLARRREHNTSFGLSMHCLSEQSHAGRIVFSVTLLAI